MQCNVLLAVALILFTLSLSAYSKPPATQPAQKPDSPPEIVLNATPLADALDSLRDLYDANLIINWKALEEVGIGRDLPVTIKLQGISFTKALGLILKTAGEDKIGIIIDDNIIQITSRQIADKILVTRSYDVQDLVMDIPDFEGPDFSLQGNNAIDSSGGGSNNSPLANNNASTKENNLTPQQRADMLVQTIVETIRPEIWKENGGSATIRYFQGKIIVTAPRSIHDLLAKS